MPWSSASTARSISASVVRGVPEQGAVVDERSDQVEDQLAIDVLAQVAARMGAVERLA